MKKKSKIKIEGKPSKKKQGVPAQAGEIGSRGIGNTFAYAVANMQEDAKEISQNKQAYLGKEKKTVETKDYAHSLVSGKKPKV